MPISNNTILYIVHLLLVLYFAKKKVEIFGLSMKRKYPAMDDKNQNKGTKVIIVSCTKNSFYQKILYVWYFE